MIKYKHVINSFERNLAQGARIPIGARCVIFLVVSVLNGLYDTFSDIGSELAAVQKPSDAQGSQTGKGRS